MVIKYLRLRYKSSSGVVCKKVGNGQYKEKYEGEIKNGKPHGFGILIFPNIVKQEVQFFHRGIQRWTNMEWINQIILMVI